MRIKTEKEQIRERISELDSLISHQINKVNRVYKRLRIKDDWTLSFWILDSSSTLHFIYRKEDDILSQLKEYQSLLQDRL